MQRLTIPAILLLATLSACAPTPPTGRPTMSAPTAALIPAPAVLELHEGTLNLGTEAVVAAHPLFLAEARLLAEQCGLTFALPTATRIDVVLTLSETPLPDEGYELDITGTGVAIRASTPNGAWRGAQTLRQLLLDGRTLPLLHIADAPRFPWRGMLLDCGRHMMSVEYVKKAIDRLSLHRMNVLHWHLTEDQGWRLAVDAYPKLTEVGAWRSTHSSGDEGGRYGGFYTKEQVREIVAYAAARHVTVVPEIELPGHSVAALAAYPELSCTGGPFEVETQWGVHADIYCAGNDSVFTFLETVLGEVLELFPSEFIHIGGDEAPKERWEECPKCQARIRDEGLADEHELQSWFIGRIGDWLESQGRRMIGWDEILEGGLPDGATVQSWRGMDGALAAVRSGHDAVVSPTSHCYLDYDTGTTSLRKSYSFEPVPPGLTDAEADRILGGEGNMWTEYAPEEIVDTKIWPRLAALAERLWSPADRSDFFDFSRRWRIHKPRLEALGVTPGPEGRPVSIAAHFDPVLDGFVLECDADAPELQLAVGTPDSPPDPAGLYLDTSLVVKGSGTVLVQAVWDGEAWGEPAVCRLVRHAGVGREPVSAPAFSPRYAAGGTTALIDGLRGSGNYRDGRWQGVERVDLELVHDLGKPRRLSRITGGFLQDANSWIFLPTSVEVDVSDDGVAYRPLGAATHDVSNKVQDKVQWDAAVEADGTPARFIRLTARNVGACPAWHPGAGGDAWIFCDEVIIETEDDQ